MSKWVDFFCGCNGELNIVSGFEPARVIGCRRQMGNISLGFAGSVSRINAAAWVGPS